MLAYIKINCPAKFILLNYTKTKPRGKRAGQNFPKFVCPSVVPPAVFFGSG